jgi:NAD(P)-dependent dehydrogenase (short-subunit alcohol dehydrogenase family)
MKNKVALITGCSSGIGEDIALKLANENWTVLAGVRKQADFDMLSAKHTNIRCIFLDVAKTSQVDACVDWLNDENIKLDVLINNAGIAVGGPIETSTREDWEQVFAVNVFGLVDITRKLLPFLRQSQGRIINIGSISGLIASPFMGIYAASKFAVEGLSDSLRREVQRFGVSVSVIEPGPIKTKIWEKGVDQSVDKIATLSPLLQEAYGEKMRSFKKAIDNAVDSALDVSHTTAAIYHACSSPNPKTRYIVSKRAKMIKFLRVLPDTIADKLMLRIR